MEQYLKILNRIEEFAFLIFESYLSNRKENQSSVMELIEIKKMLNYKDLRSVLKWCDKNNVFVFNQGNMQLVNRNEFMLAYHKPFINHLQRTCKNWKEEFVNYIEGNFMGLLKDQETKAPVRYYKPKSDTEKSFLKKIKAL